MVWKKKKLGKIGVTGETQPMQMVGLGVEAGLGAMMASRSSAIDNVKRSSNLKSKGRVKPKDCLTTTRMRIPYYSQ